MPVDLPRAPSRGAEPETPANPAAVPIPRFHLRLPDVSSYVSAEHTLPNGPEKSPPGSAEKPVTPPVEANGSRHCTGPPRGSLGDARAKLSEQEQRYADGQREVTGMIEELRGNRQRLFRRLWFASVLLTAASVVALGVEILQQTDILRYFDDTDSTAEPSIVRASRTFRSAGAGQSTLERSDAPRVWSNGLPGEVSETASSVEQATGQKPTIEQINHSERTGVWLPGTITEVDSDGPDRGEHHDDHQSRTP
jgi:hypothetical protein